MHEEDPFWARAEQPCRLWLPALPVLPDAAASPAVAVLPAQSTPCPLLSPCVSRGRRNFQTAAPPARPGCHMAAGSGGSREERLLRQRPQPPHHQPTTSTTQPPCSGKHSACLLPTATLARSHACSLTHHGVPHQHALLAVLLQRINHIAGGLAFATSSAHCAHRHHGLGRAQIGMLGGQQTKVGARCSCGSRVGAGGMLCLNGSSACPRQF